MKQRGQTDRRKRKMLLIFPMLVIPFLTLAFWALGGGTKGGNPGEPGTGLNPKLPDSRVKNEASEGKLSFYERAEKDSDRLAEAMRNDPFYRRSTEPFRADSDVVTGGLEGNFPLRTTPYEVPEKDPETEILKRVARLQQQLSLAEYSGSSNEKSLKREELNEAGYPKQKEPLEDLIMGLNANAPDDPEMDKMDNMLDKILEIQHPEKASKNFNSIAEDPHRKVMIVTRMGVQDRIGTLDTARPISSEGTGFLSLQNTTKTQDQNTIRAIVEGTQSLVSGSILKLSLLNDISVSGQLIPSRSIVYGTCSLEAERLQVTITSIRKGSSLFPVHLDVYDQDGLPGIYVPGVLSRDVVKQSVDNSLQSLDAGLMDPSLKAQMAAGGMGLLKNILSRKAKQIRVTVKAGYQVLLLPKQN
jgi:conjugative transposon TraM protein